MSFISSLIFLVVFLKGVTAGPMPDACTLLSRDEINSMLGCAVAEGTSNAHGAYCARRSSDNAIQVAVQYVDFHSPSTAAMMIKTNYDNQAKQIADGKKAVDVYGTITAFAEGGTSAYVMTGDGTGMTRSHLIRLQFVLGGYLVTFDADGLDPATVTPKLPAIYALIKKHSGL